MAKKLWEILQEEAENNQQSRIEAVRQANQKFNEYTSKNGAYDATKHTTSMDDIIKAKKNVSKESANNFKKANNISLWDTIKSVANGSGYIVKKTGAGAVSGTAGIAQAGLTDMANSMEKGNTKTSGEIAKNLISSTLNAMSPIKFNINTLKSAPDKVYNMLKTINDEDKTALEKVTSLGLNTITDAMDNTSIKNFLNSSFEYAGKLNPNLDEKVLEINNKISEPVNKINQGLAEEGENYGEVTNTLANVGQAVGNMVPSILTTAITKNPKLGLLTMGMSAKGQSTQEALNKGAELNEAVKIGNSKAMVEVGTEMLTGGVNIFGKGALDDIVEKGIVDKVKNNVAKFLVKQGVNASGEVLEETISDLLGTAIDKGTINPDATYSLKDWGDTAITTTLTTFVLNILTGGTVGEIKEIKYENEGNKNAQKWIKQAKNIINQNNTSNLQPQSTQNKQILPTQQTNQQENKIAQNGNMKPILSVQRYVYEKSDNVKVDNFRKDASKYWDNSEKTRNYVDMLEKIIQDKNIDIRLDANLRDSKGNIANGSYSNGVITINPNSTRAGEFIAIHELTHAIGTDQMRNIIKKYRKSNTEFNSAVEQLLKNYNSTELTEEAMADVAGQLFGNQEFINNLAQTEPSLFQKIYNEIKYLWHQFTGYKNQDQFINDLQYKWEQAYRSNTRLNETTNYYIEPVEKFNEIEYNNVIEEKLGKREYAILRSIINSDSNIKPGINYVEVTNGRYTVYYKGFDDFKVMSRKVDADAGRINKRNDATGRKTRYSKTFEQSIGNEGTTASNDEISNFNTTGTRERSGSNTSSSTNIKNGINLPTQESENNSGSFNLPKLKEGYTRLYRGLENEYDANYDKSKLDNSNGYESWTDSYELAKAYGDNVYYIDIPTSEIKNSIIDEDSQSETYGDRNLLYKNDKPVGIKGKSGNEYMLYTDHDNHGNIKYNKIDNNNSTRDNKGRTLTKEQQEYFKDSKVRDEKGNLLTMYHGTPNGNYTIFKDGSYFSPRKEYADGYQNTWASAISTKQNVNNPKTYEVYLNITNPFTLQDSKAKSIYLNEFIKGGNSLSYDPYTDWTNDINNLEEIDWTEAEDLREWLVENHPEYDGLILDEGGDGGYGEAEYRWRGKSFVPFNSNQIKNVDNTNPSSNSDIRYSLPTKEWQQYLEDNYKSKGTRTKLEDIKLPTKQEKNMPVNEEKRVAQILEKPVHKVKEKDRSWAIIKANLIDKGMVFEELSRKTGNRDLQGKWDYTLISTARGQNAIGNARYELDPNTKTQKQISKSLTDIIDEVGENTANFYNYMYHQLNIDRMTLEERFGGDTGINYERKNKIKNKPVFGESITAQMSREKVQELEKKYPEFKEYAQDVYDYLDANTKELVDNGIISKETQQLFKDMYPHYVPISRIDTKGISVNVPLDTGRTGINSPIKKATGGSSNINPLFETMADRTLQTYRASARNNFGVELKNTLSKTNQLNQIKQQSDIDTIMEQMTDEKQNNQLLQEGKNGEKPTFTVFENGNKVTYEISKDMYDALKPKNELLSKIDENKASKIANKVNNFRRGLLTEYNPVFSLTNAIKDSQDILLNSQHSAKTYSKIPEATAQILSKGYWYNEYIQNGGAQNSYFKDGEFEVTKNNVPTKIKNTVTFPLRAISNVNNVIEMTPRLAEYIVSREQGRSIETSMLDASRVTTNFKAGGDITKTLNRNGFTFLNASVQGMQQQIRNIQEANAKGLKGYAVLACKYAIAGVPVLLLNNLIWADDEEYDELQDYVKDNYYVIGKLSNGKFLRIPKGRAVATIQKIVSNANDFIKNDTINSDEVGKVFWEDLKENIQFARDNLAPNNPLENNIVSPVFQAITNKTWYGEDLVPTRLQNKPKEEQYDESTDKLSRWLGEKTGMSPIKINYLLDQYSGGAGDILLPLGTPQAENNVIEDKFTTDSTMKSKYPGEFFSKVDELEINSNSSKATDEDIVKYKYISSVSSEIGKLYKKKREIQNSNETDEKKKEQLKEVQKQINELAKNSIENVDKITKGEKYAQIDTSQYYKDVEGEWQKVSDKDKEKNKKSELSLKTYSSYKYEMSKIKQQKVKKGEMTKDQSLKNDDKIQILLDSNYSDKEKTAIYENYIKTQTKEGEYDSFDVIKASSIDIDEYLKYEQQDFISDKKDDGTLDGKTVSKSKQKKVVQYLNSMKINGNQRLLLYAMQGYTTNSSQKSQLAQYVYNLKLDKDTKLELYNKFSGFKVYKDGRVKW